MSWKSISSERAKTHPLYGVNGWLLLFAVGQAMSIVAILSGPLISFLSSPETQFANLIFGMAYALTQMPMLYALFKLRPNFRMVAIVTVLIQGLFATFIAAVSTAHPDSQALRGIFLAVIWIAYLNSSRRVSVTFNHLVRDNDPLLQDEQNAPGEPITSPGRSEGHVATTSGTVTLEKITTYQLLKKAWIGLMIVTALVMVLPTLAKHGVAFDDIGKALLRASIAVLVIFFVGVLLASLLQKKVRMAILMFALVIGLGTYMNWHRQQEAKYDAEQVALLKKQIDESTKAHEQAINDIHKKYQDLSATINLASAAKGKRETDIMRTNLQAMEKILDAEQSAQDRSWQDRLILVKGSPLSQGAKTTISVAIKNKQTRAISFLQRINQLEKNNIQTLLSTLDFIENNRKSVSAREGNIAFASPALLAEYNKRLLAMRQTYEEEKRLQRDYQMASGANE